MCVSMRRERKRERESRNRQRSAVYRRADDVDDDDEKYGGECAGENVHIFFSLGFGG